MSDEPNAPASGVGQLPRTMCVCNDTPVFLSTGSAPPRLASGVGLADTGCIASLCDPVEPLADMGGVHGASRDIDPPAGVTFTRQISEHSVEPTIASRSRNLFSHDERGPTGGDEAKEVGPQVPRVVDTGAFAGDRERLARAGSGPEGPVSGKPGNPGCE
jgi:hypothetical protein